MKTIIHLRILITTLVVIGRVFLILFHPKTQKSDKRINIR